MRVMIALVFVVGLLLPTLAAERAAPIVQLRDFLDQRNVVIESQQAELGTITDKYDATLTFYTLVCSSPSAKPNTMQGMEIVMMYPKAKDVKEGEEPTSISAYLDYDELSVFKDSIGTIVNAVDDWGDAKSLYTIALKSRDDFTIRISKYPGAAACVVSVSGYDGKDFVFTFFETPQHLLSIKGYIEKALKVLPPPTTKA